MKILTPRNNKDYYDYLSGIYGIDPKVVYDRRQFTVLETLNFLLFSKIRTDKDGPLREVQEYDWFSRHRKKITKLKGNELYCLLEVGLKWFRFKVVRYLNEKNEVCLDWTMLESVDITKEKRLGDAPMSFYKACNNSCFWDSSIDFQVISEEGISNPILQGTPIVSLVSAQKMYDALYAYISSLNDIEFSDTRTDVQKLESVGFDRKTSFRYIK